MAGHRQAANGFEAFLKDYPAVPEAPDEPWLREEQAEVLGKALERLEAPERLLLRLIYWDGVSYEQAARVTGIPANSIGSMLSRARSRLRALLEGNS